MTDLVLDSGILIASLLPDEPLASQANAFMQAHVSSSINAPRLFRYEISAVLRKAVYTKRLTHEDALELLKSTFKAPVIFYDDDELMTSAFRFARDLNQPRAYDTQYITLADRLGCDFWTTDETLVNSVQSRFKNIRWLGSFVST